MSVITVPYGVLTDASGNPLTGCTAAVSGITTKTGAAITPTSDATPNVAGVNLSVDYDAVANGESWINLTVTRPDTTTYAVSLYAAVDSSLVASGAAAAANNSSALTAISGFLSGLVAAVATAVWAAAARTLTSLGTAAPSWYTAPANNQTGDTYALVNPLIASGKFTTAALSNAPTGSGGGGSSVSDSSVQADVTAALTAGGLTVTNLVSSLLHGVIDGTVTLKQAEALKLAYDEGTYTKTDTDTTRTLVFNDQEGQPIATTVDALVNGAPVGRTSVTFSNLPT